MVGVGFGEIFFNARFIATARAHYWDKGLKYQSVEPHASRYGERYDATAIWIVVI